MEHTPGEWYRSGLTIRYDDTMSGTHPVIAEVSTEVGIERATANARLIAAAPDMLAALGTLALRYGWAVATDERRRATYIAARAAIAKARGTL
jgi:hypothetical protein